MQEFCRAAVTCLSQDLPAADFSISNQVQAQQNVQMESKGADGTTLFAGARGSIKLLRSRQVDL